MHQQTSKTANLNVHGVMKTSMSYCAILCIALQSFRGPYQYEGPICLDIHVFGNLGEEIPY